MFVPGLLCGIGAALFQNCGYVLSRLHVKRGGDPLGLLIATQLWMGLSGLLIAPAVLLWGVPRWDNWLWLPLCGSAFGSLFGQYFFFRAERCIDPAKLSSLMGLRVVVVSLILLVGFGETYTLLQAAAVLLAAFSAFVTNWKSGGFNWRGMDKIGMTLFFYAFCDLSVMHLVRGLGCGKGVVFGGIAALAAVDLVLGGVTLFGIALSGALRRNFAGRAGAEFSAVWLVKQFFLYLCYGWIGPVFGNVVMALRGPLATLLDWTLEKSGVRDIEEPGDSAFSLRRIAAAAMMTLAIVLYALG